MTQMTVLQPGDPFPSLTVALPGGRTLRLPDALAGRYGVVLYYRGSWCPYCNAQLSAFQRSLDNLADADVSIVALSVDDEATTADLIARHGLRFPSVTAPTPPPSRARPAPSSTPARHTCSPPVSCSTPAAGSSSASTPAARSAGSSRRTSPAWPVTSANTPRPASALARRESPAHRSREHVNAAHLT